VHVILMFENEKECRFTAVLQPGPAKQVTVVEGGRLNRRETEYHVTVDHGYVWKVILLAMPTADTRGASPMVSTAKLERVTIMRAQRSPYRTGSFPTS
jgi:hypothetical protein